MTRKRPVQKDLERELAESKQVINRLRAALKQAIKQVHSYDDREIERDVDQELMTLHVKDKKKNKAEELDEEILGYIEVVLPNGIVKRIQKRTNQ